MNINRRVVALFAGAASAALVLSGCAGQSTPASSAAVQTIESGTFTCAMSGEYRPFNYYGDDSTLQGFDVDICTAIAEQLGLQPAPVTGAFNTLIAGLQANRYDAIVGSMAITDERKSVVDFSDPYYETGSQLFVQKDSDITSVDALEDATVGVALGTTFEAYARSLSGVSDVNTYQADIDALRDLEAGRLDAAITQSAMGAYLIKNADLKLAAAGGILAPDIAAIPVFKGNTALRDEINSALAAIHEDGTFADITTKWFGAEDVFTTTG